MFKSHLESPVASEGLRIGRETSSIPAVITRELSVQVRRRLSREGSQVLHSVRTVPQIVPLKNTRKLQLLVKNSSPKWQVRLTMVNFPLPMATTSLRALELLVWPRNRVLMTADDPAAVTDAAISLFSVSLLSRSSLFDTDGGEVA